MVDNPDDLERMFEVAPKMLDATKALVQFLGPFRHFHPEWEQVADAARANLTECNAAKARRMDRALALLRDTEKNHNQLAFDRDQLEEGRITTQARHELPLLNELRLRGLVELVEGPENDSSPTFTIHDLDEVKKLAAELSETASEAYRRARRLASRCERMARPALQDAEFKAASAWTSTHVEELRKLHVEAVTFIAKHSQDLPGLIDLEGQSYCGRKFSSACAAMCGVSETLIDHASANGPDGRWDRLQAIDYEDLGVKVECELAALRRHSSTTPRDKRHAASIDFALQRVLIDAEGKPMGFAQIFDSAKKNPKTSDLFPMAKHNSNREDRIRALVGLQTKDGWIIRSNKGHRGRRRMFWAEKLAE